MDLKQIKLSKSEWDSIEIPVASQEKEVLDLIIKGYSDVNIKINKLINLYTNKLNKLNKLINLIN